MKQVLSATAFDRCLTDLGWQAILFTLRKIDAWSTSEKQLSSPSRLSVDFYSTRSLKISSTCTSILSNALLAKTWILVRRVTGAVLRLACHLSGTSCSSNTRNKVLYHDSVKFGAFARSWAILLSWSFHLLSGANWQAWRERCPWSLARKNIFAFGIPVLAFDIVIK